MAIGDAALAAGMLIVDGNATQARDIDTEINRSRDYIAERTNPGTLAVADGGTGAETAAAARTNLGAIGWADVSPAGQASAGGIARYSAAGRLQAVTPAGVNDVATVGWVEDRIGGFQSGVPASGGTFTGNVYFPNAGPAQSGYSVAYIDGTGRLSRSPSAAKYKDHIADLDPAELGDIWPQLVRYQMRGGDASWKVGYIADELAKSPAQAPFVVYGFAPDENGVSVPTDEVESIDFIALLIAQNAQLHDAFLQLQQRVDELESRA